MKFCSKCGKEIMDEAVICPNCGCEVDGKKLANTVKSENDNVSIGLCILAALIPIFGVIYWPIKHNSTPIKAKACGITGIVAWVVYLLISLSMGM